jgi:RHS repeat-associated protein
MTDGHHLQETPMTHFAHRIATTLSHGVLTLAGLCAGAAQAQSPGNVYNYSRSSSFTYQVNGLLQSETIEPDPGNVNSCVVTTHSYDVWGNKNAASTANCPGAAGRAVFATRANGSTFAAQTVTIGGNAAVLIPAGQFATTATNALSQSETRVYDPRFGVVTSLTGPNGLTTTFIYDDFGRKIKETRADGTSSVTLYCIIGAGLNTASNSSGCSAAAMSGSGSVEIPSEAVSYIQSEPRDTSNALMGPVARAYQDRQGRTIREVSEFFDGPSQPAARRYVAKDTRYNSRGVAQLTTAPYFLGAESSTVAGTSDMGMTLTAVDALGRPVTIDVADPQGNVPGVNFADRGTRTSARSTVVYSGLVTTTTNAKGQTRIEEKNADGRLVRVTDAYGAQIAYQHDAFGNLLQTQDALKNIVKIAYDIRGRKTAMDDPDTGRWAYDYNALGELVWQQSPNQLAAVPATATTMGYDLLGRMTSRVEPEFTSTWSYDKYIADAPGTSTCAKGIGKLCESNANHGVNKKYAFDHLGRPSTSRTVVSGGPSFATAVSYQAGTGRVLTQSYPTGVAVQYAYSTRGFVTQLQLATAAAVNPLPASPGGAPVAGTTLPVGTALWTAGTVNAWGKAETQTLGPTGVSGANPVIERAVFEAATGRVTSASAGIGSATNVLNHTYAWDSLNNLSARTDGNGDGNTGAVSETFLYDSINRLKQYVVSAPQIPNQARTVDLYYNAIGNLLYKGDVGNYEYPLYGNSGGVSNPKPHAVSRVVGTSFGTVDYGYDANGNMVSASGGKYRSVSYTSFNLPDSNTGLAGAGGSPRYTWKYDESHQRISETRVNGSGTRTTWYQGNFESEVAPSGAVSNRHYVSAGGQTIVLVSTGALPMPPALPAFPAGPPVLTSAVLVKVEYWHKDHLGSIAATTDHAGNVTARYAYDPFGKRRYTNGQYDAFGTLVVDWTTNTNNGTDRGYTGHEHLDDLGVVHMNGRIFDPVIARFMQGDPLIQDPLNLQNYNRYTYCYSNPLTCTDPSGLSMHFKDYLRAVVSIAVVVFAPEIIGFLGPALGVSSVALNTLVLGGNLTFAGAAVAGFAGGVIATGTIQGGIQGAFTAGVMFGVGNVINGGEFFSNPAIRTGAVSGFDAKLGAVMLHGVAGCVTSAASGGKCGAGAMSAAFSEFATVNDMQFGGKYGVISAAIVGGTASVLGGGQFANGAVTAAMGYLFNELMHSGWGGSARDRSRRAGYAETPYDDGTYCNIQSAGGGVCGFPGGSADSSSQAGGSAGWSAGIGLGASYELAGMRGTNGQACLIQSHCVLAGPFAGYAADFGGALSSGSPGPGLQLGVFGKAAFPLLGFELAATYGSDGAGLQLGKSFGQMYGGGVKVCVQSTVSCSGPK